MKICTICKLEKEDSNFNKNKGRKDGLNNICKPCGKARSKQYYFKNQVKHKLKVKERRKQLVNNNRKLMLDLLKESKCKDCGNKDFRVFEFDHLRDKKSNISEMLRSPWPDILKEIQKCEIVCANCHKLRTIKRSNSYRNTLP